MLDATIIGAGRVGLPLALSLEESGMKIGIKDINEVIISSLKEGKMPFHEPGYDELIKNTNIEYSSSTIPLAKCYIITVGTPLKQHIETDLSSVTKVINELIDSALIKDSIIILRSTVAPNTTDYIVDHIKMKTGLSAGIDYIIGMCPERIAEGLAKKELKDLPQLIGVYDDKSYEKIKNVFYPLIGNNTIKTTPIESELSKLFCNIYRYINFAIPNYFMYLADQFNVEPYRILDAMSLNYPRVKGLAKPGFTGGACVRGERKVEVIQNNNPIVLTFHSFYEEFHKTNRNDPSNTHRYTISSFSSDLSKEDIKNILDVTCTNYTGNMYIFELENGKTFECTEDHLIPTKGKNGPTLKEAKDINADDVLYIK